MSEAPLPSDAAAAIGSCATLSSLAREAVLAIARVSEHLALEDGQILVREGEAGADLYLLVRGGLVIETVERGELARLGPGSLVGEMQLLTGGFRTATVRAVEPSGLLRMRRDDLRELEHRFPPIRAVIAEGVRARFRRERLARLLVEELDVEGAEELEELLGEVEWLALAPGDVLVREGDPSDALYFLLQGRLATVSGVGRRELLLGEVQPGESIGETAVLEGQRRRATVRAIRPSEVAKISRRAFLDVSERHPAILRRLVTVILARQGGERARRGPSREAFALVPISDLPIDAVVAQIKAALGERAIVIDRACVTARFGDPRVADLEIAASASLGLQLWLDHLDVAHDIVLFVGDSLESGWTRRCVACADEVVLVADATSDPTPSVAEQGLVTRFGAGLRSSLLLLSRASTSPSRTSRWLRGRRVELVLHARREQRRDFERVARFLTGTAIGVVISGGAARSVAGVGLLRAMVEQGVPIDAIGGVSAGALLGASYALLEDPEQTLAQFTRIVRAATPDLTLPLVSLLSAQTLIDAFRTAFGDRDIEDLPLPCLFVSSNLTRAELRVSRQGPLVEQLFASNAMPPIIPPMVLDGDLHADGALLNNVPIAEMKQLVRGGPVIALDVTPSVEFEHNAPTPGGLSGWRVALDRLRGKGERAQTPNALDILFRAQLLHHVAMMREVQSLAEVYVHPELRHFGLADHGRHREIAAAGYAASIGPLRQWWSASAPTIAARSSRQRSP
ncbi:MAG: cyclic nucleotide-binding and patatin-like phospholipase domain-containing protein [Sandaracinus sp.]